MRHSRLLVWASVLALFACTPGSGVVPPPPPPPPIDQVTITIVTPTQGQTINQNGWPNGSVLIQINASSSLRGAITPTMVKLDSTKIGPGSPLTANTANGSHTLLACVVSSVTPTDSACASVSFVVSPAPPIVVEIVTSPTLGATQCDAFRAYAQRGAVTDSADFSSSCLASISPRLALLPDTGRTMVWFDAKDKANRTHFPGLASVAKDSLTVIQKFVAARLQYAIHSGIWTGQTIGIDLVSAFTISTDRKIGFYFRTMQRDGSFFYSVGGRSPSTFPVQIAIRKESGQAIPPTDTTGFGSAVAELSNELGIPHVLVSLASAQVSGWSGVMVTVTDTAGGGLGVPIWGPNGDIVGGSVTLGPELFLPLYRFPVKHELGHALGVGHPALWCPSLMSLNQGCMDSNDPRFGVPQPLETGHLWFMYDVWEAKKQSGAQYGIPNMYQGWRVLVLGLPYEAIR